MNYLEVFGTLIGMVYLWLEYRASIYLWAACIVMPAVYLVVYYRAGLYADFGINVYYLLASVYGWWVWRKGATSAYDGVAEKTVDAGTGEIPISNMPRRYYLPLAAIFLLAWVGIAVVLLYATDSNVPWADSFTTALSIVAMWMLARKYVEQWGVWMLVDWVCFGLYLYKGLYFTAVLYAVYAVVAVFGWRKWLTLKQKELTNPEI